MVQRITSCPQLHHLEYTDASDISSSQLARRQKHSKDRDIIPSDNSFSVRPFLFVISISAIDCTMSSRPRTQPNRRIERSCAVCHRRKVRCNKTLPCSHCIRSGFECTYPPAGPTVRRAKKTTISDVASRISHMEKTIEAFKAGQVAAPQPSESVSSLTPTNTSIATPATTFNGGELRESVPRSNATERNRDEGLLLNKGRFSHYVNEVLLSRVIQQVRISQATRCIPSNTASRKMMYGQPSQHQGMNPPVKLIPLPLLLIQWDCYPPNYHLHLLPASILLGKSLFISGKSLSMLSIHAPKSLIFQLLRR